MFPMLCSHIETTKSGSTIVQTKADLRFKYVACTVLHEVVGKIVYGLRGDI